MAAKKGEIPAHVKKKNFLIPAQHPYAASFNPVYRDKIQKNLF
jgi:hypothetical protein